MNESSIAESPATAKSYPSEVDDAGVQAAAVQPNSARNSGRTPAFPALPVVRFVLAHRPVDGQAAPVDRQPLSPLASVPAPFPVRIPVVALVTSAGGLNALTCILAGLPADLPAAVLVGQHRSPSPSVDLLAELLDRSSPLPVRAARDGDRLQFGHVLVTPPAAHLIVTPTAAIGLIDTGQLPPSRPSADLMLATLAVTTGPRAMAVVLTGQGHDAQAGIRAVHRCGGTVLAEDEGTAEHFGMPSAAIATGLVHGVHPLHALSGAITAHLAEAGAVRG
jgi:two-component system, chemotaxis family, protein-glutamate methylesterase/glutaminase